MAKHQSKPHRCCPLCGGTKFTGGHITGYAQRSEFLPEGESLLKRFVGVGGAEITTMRCDACGYLLQFAGGIPAAPES